MCWDENLQVLFTEKHALIPHINKTEHAQPEASLNHASIWLKEEKKNIEVDFITEANGDFDRSRTILFFSGRSGTSFSRDVSVDLTPHTSPQKKVREVDSHYMPNHWK